MKNSDFTKRCFSEALLKLCAKKPYCEISVSELCETAGCNRSTYYRNFGSMDEILLGIIRERANSFVRTTGEVLNRGEHFKTNAARMFYLIKDNAALFTVAHSAKLDFQIMELFSEAFTAQFGVNENSLWYRSFHAGGYYLIAAEWLVGGMKEPPEKMGELLAQIVEESTIF